jgi:signal transduction histidine kinase
VSERQELLVVLAATAAAAGVLALVLGSEHLEAQAAWAIFGPGVGLSFVLGGLYARRLRPDSGTGRLMVLLGFAWFLSMLEAANARLPYTLSLVFAGGLWGAVFLHLAVSFPSGRLAAGWDRRTVAAGYVIFPLSTAPAALVAAPEDWGCEACPTSLLLIERDQELASLLLGLSVALYIGLFLVVLVRAVRRWRRSEPLERLQLTPVYVCALLAFLLVTLARAGIGEGAWWAGFIASGFLPVAFVGGLLRSRVSHLDAELHARLEELRASRARLVEAGDAARRKLERDLHDGAQARFAAVALLLRTARKRADGQPELAELLDRSIEELRTGLSELRELARGIHPAVLTDRGLEPAIQALVSRVPVAVTVDADVEERLPDPVEVAAYFVVSEALANVAKYARATHATVEVRRVNGSVRVQVTDDGIGGADVSEGSGLRGLTDRVAALDGTLELESPAGRGTRLHAEIPVRPPAAQDDPKSSGRS